MNILKKLSFKSLILNKKRTVGTVIGIILSTSLICAVSGMFNSFQKTLIQNAINEEGYYHIELSDVTSEDVKDLLSNRNVRDVMSMYDLGYALFGSSSEDYPYIHIYSSDDIKDLSFKITSGRRPSNSDEIMVSKAVLMNSDIKIGDVITLDVGIRVTNDGYELKDSNPYYDGEESLIDTVKKSYKVVGSFTKVGYNYSPYGITTKEKNDSINAYVSLKNPKNYRKDIPNVLGQKNWNETELRDLKKSKYVYQLNSELLRWEAFAFSDSTVSMLSFVLGVVVAIIIVCSVFCIRNSFAISVTERTKMYGMLSSVGATKKQIRKSVIFEGFVLGLIGVPLGILSGVFADFVLIKVINKIFDGNLFTNLNEILFDISFMSVLLSIILGFITIYFSCVSTARRASKVSPIVNITNSASVKLNYSKLKSPKFIDSFFGIGGVLAYKNLKRSKKKYRTTVISITISVFVFITMNSFLTETFDLSSRYYNDYDYNIQFNGIRNLTDPDFADIRKLESVNSMHILYKTSNHSAIRVFDTSKMELLDVVSDLTDDCYIDDNDERVCTGKKYLSLELLSLDDASYKEYISKLDLNYDDVKSKGILVDDYRYSYNNKEKNKRIYNYKVGDKIIGTFLDEDVSILVGCVSNVRPFGMEYSYYSGGYLIVNKDYFEEFDFSPYDLMIDASQPDDVIKYVESIDSDISSINYAEERKQDHAMKLVISIFLYGFITVITLIGVTSIFNTITSNMELRSKEFGVLKSIGMTKSEFKHMINLETLFYSFKSLMFGIVLGLIGSYILHLGFSEKNDTVFKFPFVPIVISIVFVFLLVYVIMKFSISKINKQNTIETIRNDNI